jgi:hypothetical protein
LIDILKSRKMTAGPTGGNDTDNANRITYDEFAILVRRIDRMEYSIGNIVSRVKKFFFLFGKNSIGFFM